jgi:hypothetical protein
MLVALVDWIRAFLITVLVLTTAILAALLIGILVGHVAESWRGRRRQTLVGRYRPVAHALVDPERAEEAIGQLIRVPAWHREIVAAELLAVVRVASGSVIDRVRDAAVRLGFVKMWRRALVNRRWWIRAEGARALGCVRAADAVRELVIRLEDVHEEVRAAAVEALGAIGDPRAVGPLVAGLSYESRLQRARVVLALRAFGPTIVEPLLEHERKHRAETATTADLLGQAGAVTAMDTLTDWSSDPRPEVREAALRALGTLGPCDRTFYFALRALSDGDAGVRAMAARAVGRSGRRDAVPYLASTLTDDWSVAVHAARGLRDLGAPGRLELERACEGPARDLVAQMLWELDRRQAAAQAS